MGPAVACSPPTSVARSPALPIARGAARLVPCARISNDGGAVTAERRSEDGASPLLRPSARFSFSSKSCTPASRSQSAASASAAAGGSLRSRPPAGPSAVKAQNVLIGFDAPSETHAPPKAAPPSPGRRETSLLSIALSDLPPVSSGGGAAAAAGSAFSPALDLFGTTSPSGGFLRRQDSSEPDFAQLDALAGQHPVMASPVVRAAYAAASRAHAGQLRKSGEPVISHCLATAAILAELGLPEETVAAGLLHDVLSDTRVTAWQLEEHVPRSCVELVEKVTRLSEVSQLYRDNAHSLEAASILHMLTSMSDVSALLVKLADRLHNMRTVGALSRCKQVRMASETLDVFAVLANRLGAWSVKAELEDLAFKTLQPEDYEQVFSAVAERAALIDLPARVAQVRAALAAAGLEVVDVSGRVKNIYGVWRKLQAGGLGVDRIDEVYDVAALRVVVPHKHDCYRALREVEGLWAAVPGRFKDYVRNRKGNGYQSLHTTVFTGAADAGAGAAPAIQGADDPAAAAAAGLPVPSLLEVQIRTPKMHYIAEYGFAAHWRYKEKLSREDLWLDRLVQWKKWVAAEKLRLRDSKVREGGSPQRDPVLAALIESLAAASPDASLDDAPAAAAAPAAAPTAAFSAPAAASAFAAAAAAAGSVGSLSSPAAGRDARFLARFGIQPVSEEELDGHAAQVLISGPRGVRVEGLPARCTLAELLAGPAVSEQEARGCSLRLNGRAVPLLDARRGAALRTGDHVTFVPEPLLKLAPHPAPAAAPAFGLGEGAGAARLDSLDVYLPGCEAPVEVALGRAAAAAAPLRPSALVS